MCLSLLVVGLDMTVLNVALTRIATTLSASTTKLQWIVNSYVLTYAMLMVPAGVLGDRIGRVKVRRAESKRSRARPAAASIMVGQ
jgi:MFS family permease